MSHSLLLPNRYKKIGWCLFVPMLVIGVLVFATNYEATWLHGKVFTIWSGVFADKNAPKKWFIETNLTNTLLGVLFIIGALLVGFSKEKNEDEYIARLRLNALLWAVLINYILLLIAFILVYDLPFFTVMTFNMFTVLLLFIFRFHYLLYRSKMAITDEK